MSDKISVLNISGQDGKSNIVRLISSNSSRAVPQVELGLGELGVGGGDGQIQLSTEVHVQQPLSRHLDSVWV